jgi:hypothetical protein
MGTGSFPGVESGRGVTLTPHPLLVSRSKNQSRPVPLLSLKAFVACKKGKSYYKEADGTHAFNVSFPAQFYNCIF